VTYIVRENIVALCQQFHIDVNELSDEFMSTLKRKNYVTPTSYLELILAFKQNLDKKRLEVAAAQKRYEVGLEKLAFAAEAVVQMQRTLNDLKPELDKSAKESDALRIQIEDKMPGVLATRKVVEAETAITQGETDRVLKQKEEVEADLRIAEPALDAAVAALDTINDKDISFIKNLQKPPDKIKTVCRAVCVMLQIPPVRIPDPDDPSKRIMDYWVPSQKMLTDVEFRNKLLTYNKDNIPPSVVAEIKKNYLDDPNFQPEVVESASSAAKGMCLWVRSLIIYDKVAKEVAPKKLALAEAQLALDISTGVLNEKKRAMQAVEDELSSLNADLNSAKQRKKELEDESDSCTTKIGRANDLLDGLGGERQRWGESADRLGEIYEKLTGDVLLSAGVLAYLGPFTAVFRQKQMAAWLASLKNFQIPCSDHPSLGSTLGDPVLIRKWNIEGLPTDQFSVDNGIIVFNARRWPLMIDPQGQANKWIRNMEKARELKTIKLTDANYLRTLENAITYGNPVLLENVGEELDPSLEPLLQKQIIKKGSGSYIKLGDTEVPYNADFRFYITTKLRNPHYLPEVSVKVTLLNFMITPEGLTDQLLGIVVSQERPDLEEQRNLLIVESAENKRRLKEIEDQILHIMSSSSGNILEDETAISTLKGSKAVSDEISKKQEIAERTEVDINNVRQSYAPIAYSSQILFFCITDLANIEPVYQYSLSWFINLFINSIKLSEKGRDVEKRLQNLDEHFTYSLYKNVCRSLLEKDKLLFSFLLTIRILKGKDAVDLEEWFFLLTGGTGMDNPHENPAPDWLTARCWDAVCRLSHMAKYSSFRADFVGHLREWRVIYDSLSPQDEIFPGIFSDATGLSRLCALRTIRPDKIVLAVQSFVLSTMGEAFVKPPIFDLEACYNDSSATVPLVFILSPGSDPMGAVRRAAESLHIHMDPISLGQGQGDKAKKMIENAKIKGEWVVLQNCHLAPSWMTTLEKIVEDLDPDTHPNFRIWCTTYPSDVFPVSVLQNGVKMTNEPPKGLRANLFGSFNADPINDDEFYSKCNKGFEFRRLIFGLCFFHALVQERRLYGPLGWNIPYEFNESDLKISIQQLQLFLDENDEVPYKALLYTAGECNYGGRVTDDKDRRTLLCILTRFYQADFLKEDYTITSTGAHQYKCPVDGNRQSYITFIESMPLIATPDVFGLHDNATLTKDQNDTNALLNSILDTEGGGSSAGGSSGSKDDMLSAVAADIASRLPSNFDIEMAQLKYPVRPDESMNTVLCQELIRFNNLLSLIRSSLKNIQKAVKGQVVMSSELEVLGNSLFVNRLPAMWKGKSFPSLKPLGSYVSDLHSRLQFFGEWLDHSAPSVFWISSFFFTQAFLTGSAQNFARKYIIPIDEIVFDFEMMRDEIHGTGPENGVYTQGLFIEGARWDKDIHVLTESLPKVLFAKSPTMHWIPMQKADVPVYHHYKCPVYKTSDRRGILATTGHSSNFVCFIHMPMSPADGEDHWIERGVAMLTQLDD
jgi:dynein heavy chain